MVHVNPLLVHARNSSLLLDAAAYTLDGNIIIRETPHSNVRSIAVDLQGNIPLMVERARDMIPRDCPDAVREMIELECDSMLTLAKSAGIIRPVISNTNHRAIGTSGFSAAMKDTVRIRPRNGRIKGLLYKGPSLIGVSCPFVVQNSGTAATRGFWLDNFSGLPCGDWMTHRSENLDYINEFIGGPWNGKELCDSEIVEARVKYSSIFCDYRAHRFGIGDNEFGMRFRFRWSDQMHSEGLTTETKNIRRLQSRVENTAFDTAA